MDDILALVQTLIDKGFAYAASNGDVYYRVEKFDGYGKLTRQNIDELRSGSRVDVEEAKESPLDFVLWKAAKPGEVSWESPWGPGRPGWHIECSAMSKCCLGDTFDIHGGGPDLPFPHHENEIAQSEAANGVQYVNTWMHAGPVRVNSEKMSKSLGNFFTLREVLPHLRHPEVLRYFLVASHYRGPINYTLENLTQADATLGGLYTALRGVPDGEPGPDAQQWRGEFRAAMDDDFNTPKALAVLAGLKDALNKAKGGAGNTCQTRPAELAAVFRELAALLGICQLDPEQWFRLPSPGSAESGATAIMDNAAIAAILGQRQVARRARDFRRADALREQLAQAGVIIEDLPDGTWTWRRR
jgi:cysteinyl-tRNA synthetase